MAILESTNKIFDIFIDLKKSIRYSAVNHCILLVKLAFYGIRGTSLNWMHSYLNSRLQYVQINNWKSQMLPIKSGVPQESIIGPFLFLICINDIFSCSKSLSFILLADDTNIFFQHNNICELAKIVNH